MTTDLKAQQAQLKAEIRAAELGFLVSRPTTPARYDLLVDSGSMIWRMQIKYATGTSFHSANAVVVRLHKPLKQRVTYKSHEIDGLLAYVPCIDHVLFFSAKEFHDKLSVYVRLKPSLNNQKKGVLLADDFIWRSLPTGP